MDYKIKKTPRYKHWLNGPFIWILIIPMLILDVFVELYHRIGFRLCGINQIKRSEYIKIDRHKLKYLSIGEKIGCLYCGYANGFLRYASEIAARSESYWCGIMHQKTDGFKTPEHHKNFVEYGDENAYRKKYQ